MTQRRSNALRTLFLIGAIVALLVSTILPILHRYREIASRDPCASNLRVLGQALLLYQQAHENFWPQNLADAATAEDMSPVVLKCVVSEKPFIFLRAGARYENIGENDLIAYEPPEYHDNRGSNVLFGDGHVAWLTPQELKQALESPASHPSTSLPAKRGTASHP